MAARDFISPVGELNDTLFPGVDDLSSHVEEVEGLADDALSADAREAWVYVRLYRDASLRLAARYDSYSEDGQASVKYNDEALREARAGVARWQKALDAATAVPEPEPHVHRTTSVRTRVVW